jgi:integrase
MKHQDGYIWHEKGAWFGRWRENVLEPDGTVKRVQRSKKLTDYCDRYRTKSDVRPLLDEILQPMNQRSNGQSYNMRLGQFVDDIYFPYVGQQKHKSTEIGYREKWRNYIKPLCADFWLRDVRTHDVQQMLNQIAMQHDLSRATLQRCKTLLSGIFSFAKRQGNFDGVNPVLETEIPSSAKPSGETHAYSLDEINRMLIVLPNPAHAIIAVASYAGLSRSEIEGLCWENYNGKELSVVRARVHGEFGEPKTSQRKAIVPVIPRLKTILDKYRLSVGEPASGVMFRANRRKREGESKPNDAGIPVCLNNLCNRVIKPALNRCGVCKKTEEKHSHSKAKHKFERDKSLPQWHGYHACRRGLATNLHDLGIDDLTIQRIMRHSNVAVTQKCYIKTLPEQVVEAMGKLERAVSVQKRIIPPTRSVQ